MVLGPLEFSTLFGVPLLLGALVLAALGVTPRTDRVAYLGWAWMVGAFGTAAVVCAWLWAGMPGPAAWVPGIGALLLGLVAWFLGRRGSLEPPASPGPTPTPEAAAWEVWFFRAALAFCLVVTLERIANASLVAVLATDEGTFWAFKAKLLYHEGGFGPGYAAAVVERKLGNADYPLLNPLLQVWSFAHAERITHAVNRLPIHACSVALVLALAGGLRRVARPAVAGLLLVLLASMTPFADATRLAYSDALVALGTVVGLDALLRWRAERRPGWVGLGAIAVGFLLWSKHEGALIVLAFGIAYAVDRFLTPARGRRWPRPTRLQLWGLVPLGVVVLTWWINRRYGAANFFMERRSSGLPGGLDLEGNFGTAFLANLPVRLEPTVQFFLDHVFFTASHSQYVVVLFGLLLVLAPRAIGRSPLRLSALGLSLTLMGFVLVFIGLPKDLEWHLVTAGARVVFQPVPALLLWIGAVSSLLLISARSRVRLAITVLMLFLVWRGAVAAWQTGGELYRRGPETLRAAFSRSEEGRIRAALELFEDQRRAVPGRVVSMHAALVEEVPEDGLVYVILSRDDPDRPLTKAFLLTYPRRYEFHLPPRADAEASRFEEVAGDIWVLDLAGVPGSLSPYFEVVREGVDWSLWR